MLKKKKFAIGIFLMLLIIESGIALTASALYFRHTCIKEIEKIEKHIKNYSFTLADAFTNVAELSYQADNFTSLKTLFHQEIRENTIDEAFFSLMDGTLIAHSSKEVEKELKGNIATDEFAYNIDLILRPARRNLNAIQFTSYNVMGKTVPFPREYISYIKTYIYEEIEMLGWLVSKSVYHKKNPVGTVNFLIYKNRIYDLINSQFRDAEKIYLIGQAIAFAVSLFVSIVVVFRYRSIQKKTYELSRRKEGKEKKELPDIIEIVPDKKIAAGALRTVDDDGDYITINLYEDEVNKDDKFQIEVIDNALLEELDGTEYPGEAYKSKFELDGIRMPGAYAAGEKLINTGQIVQDAIPIEKKRH